MRVTAEWTREVDTGEENYVVVGTVSPIVPAVTDGPPDSWSPEEGGEVEIEEVYLIEADKPRRLVATDLFDEAETGSIEQALLDAYEGEDENQPDDEEEE